MTNLYIIREYQPQDKDKVISLIKDVWSEYRANRVRKVWDWLFLNNPFNPKDCSCVLVEEFQSQVIGIFCNIFVDLKIGNNIIKARWGCKFITHPKHRGKGVRLFRQALKIPYYPALGFPNKRTLFLEIKLGVHKIGDIYNYIRILDMECYLQKKIKNRFIAYLGREIWNLISRSFFTIHSSNKDISITEISLFDDRFNKFWQDVSIDYPIIVVRNQKYLNWRFIESPLKYYTFTASKHNSILGYIVLTIQEKNGLRKGFIVDILTKANDKKTLNALILKAVSYFKENKCDIAECLVFTNREIYHRALKRFGFLIKRLVVYFDGYTIDEKEKFFIKNSDNWFITASDSDLET
jgi:hypothetical protein